LSLLSFHKNNPHGLTSRQVRKDNPQGHNWQLVSAGSVDSASYEGRNGFTAWRVYTSDEGFSAHYLFHVPTNCWHLES